MIVLIVLLILFFGVGGTRLSPAYGPYSYGASGILLLVLLLLLLHVI